MEFKLIIESGSTKTDWVLINSDEEIRYSSPGINPSANESMYALDQTCAGLLKYAERVTAIHYFGAGIINAKTKLIIKEWLANTFHKVSTWQIESDMLGAALATSGNRKGIVCILGTGSNSCVYDGNKIAENIPSLGFALSNEGGGSKIGAELLKSYFYNRLPEDVKSEFNTLYKVNKSSVIQYLYLEENPTAYLASFAKFLNATQNQSWRKNFLFPLFQEFIDIRIKQYSEYINYDLHFVGSIAYFYADVIKEVLQKNNLRCSSIIHKPIDGLVRFFK